MPQPEPVDSGHLDPIPNPLSMGSEFHAAASQPPSESLLQKPGLVAAILVGVNILCLAAIIAVSGSHSKKETAARATTERAEKKDRESATTEKAAAPKAAEPSTTAAEGDPKGAAAAANDSSKNTGEGHRAVVTLPAGRTRGVLRAKPDSKSGPVAMLPIGTAVEITNKALVRAQIWYEIKTVDFQTQATGWMHENVLKID